jgi:hypothetical protein
MTGQQDPTKGPLTEEIVPPLTYMEDHPWLEEVGVAVVDERWLVAANELMTLGSVELGTKRGITERDSIVEARSRFFGVSLGWDNPSNSIHRTYDIHRKRSPVLVRPSVAVTAMRLMSNMGHDPSEIIERTGWHVLATKGVNTRRIVQQALHFLAADLDQDTEEYDPELGDY